MISRYECKEVSTIWSLESKLNLYLNIEIEAIAALKGPIWKNYFKDVLIDLPRIEEIEKTTHHDVVAFCTSITEQLPKEIGKWFHFGLTSSDICDTALMMQIKDSLLLIIEKISELIVTIKELAFKHINTAIVGRTHGQHAEVTTFGTKLLGFAEEFNRCLEGVNNSINHCVGKLSGAVGNYSIVTADIERQVLENLGLQVEHYPTQVIPRDRIARIVSEGALLATAMERFATEIRHLGRTEVDEVREGFSEGQKGSSAMPHKNNPVGTENTCGIARVIRSHLAIAHENCNLWHERDISHSSAERLYLPDHFGLLGYSLDRLISITKNLVIKERSMEAKTDNPLLKSGIFLHQILQQTNLSREEAYKIVQEVSKYSCKSTSLFMFDLTNAVKDAFGEDIKLVPN